MSRGTLLVVEDSDDLRAELCRQLSSEWRVIQASDGDAGYRLAASEGPDIIVSDLVMPGTDGFSMLEMLREDVDTSHVPVLFLTGRNDEDTRLRAYALSADGFLAKPFRFEELSVRLARMVEQRARIQEWVRRGLGAGPHGEADDPASDAPEDAGSPGPISKAISARDRAFLEGIERWVHDHHGDPSADVGGMAEAVHVTPRTLQRKIKALTGRTPAEYLRDFRMARARQMLLEGRTATEVAFELGFSSSQYFSRVFRDQHGMPPDRWKRTGLQGGEEPARTPDQA